jgi:hypothetical protein
MAPIAEPIAFDRCNPETRIRTALKALAPRHPRSSTPKVIIAKDNHTMCSENYVTFPRRLRDIAAEAQRHEIEL